MARPNVGRWFTVQLILMYCRANRTRWFTTEGLKRLYDRIIIQDKPSWKTVLNNISEMTKGKDSPLQKSMYYGGLRVYVLTKNFEKEVEKWVSQKA